MAGIRRAAVVAAILCAPALCALAICAPALCAPASQQPPSELASKLRDRLEAARQAEGRKDYAAASRSYQEILRLKPGWALIHQSLGLSYHFQNRYLEAIAAFQKALELDESLWGAHLFLGMDYYKTNQFAKAVAPLERSLVLHPEMAGPEANLWLGLSYMALGRPEEAIRRWEIGPRDVERLYRLARSYDRRAEELFERIGRLDPGSALVRMLQAERSAAERRWETAASAYRGAVARRPDLAGAVAALRRFRPPAASNGKQQPVELSAHDAQANGDRAEFLFRHGIEKKGNEHLRVLRNSRGGHSDPSTALQRGVEARKRRGRVTGGPAPQAGARSAALKAGLEALDGGRFAMAADSLARAAGPKPHRLLRLHLAEALFGAGRYQQAVEQLRELPTRPVDLDVDYWLGRAYQRLAAAALAALTAIAPASHRIDQLDAERHERNTEYEKAVEAYKRVLAKRPAAAGARYALGNVYWKMRRYAQAETWLRKELESNPYHGSAHYRLGNLYLDQGKAEQAIVHIEKAIDANPALPMARLDLGRALSAAGRHREAVEHWRLHAAADPADDRVHFLLANAYRQIGLLGDAKRALQRYRKLNRQRLETVQRDVRKAGEAAAREPASAPRRENRTP